jgi:DNA-directed RNA polymerase specialized sigma24 family protein
VPIVENHSHSVSRILRVATAAGSSLKDLEPVVARVCTEKERQALALRAAGYSWREMALILGVAKSTVCGRVENAIRKVQRELDQKSAPT